MSNSRRANEIRRWWTVQCNDVGRRGGSMLVQWFAPAPAAEQTTQRKAQAGNWQLGAA